MSDLFLTAKQKETLQQYGLQFSSWLKTEDGKKEIEIRSFARILDVNI